MANNGGGEFKLNAVKKHKTDKAWVNRHITDPYVKKATNDGYRSRAAYKLLELDTPLQLLKESKHVIDLGSAPGSWSQVARERMPSGGVLVSVDLLSMNFIQGVNFIQGDFTEDITLDKILQQLKGEKLDLILSDMAPNISGIKVVDQAKSAILIELALDFAASHLKNGGNCIIKIFEGGEFGKLLASARQLFTLVKIEKPNSSRSESSEKYLLCLNKK